jgi:hypothetical protein
MNFVKSVKFGQISGIQTESAFALRSAIDSTRKNSGARYKLLLTCFLAFHTLPPSINETHCESLIEKKTFIPLGCFCWFHRQQQFGAG